MKLAGTTYPAHSKCMLSTLLGPMQVGLIFQGEAGSEVSALFEC